MTISRQLSIYLRERHTCEQGLSCSQRTLSAGNLTKYLISEISVILFFLRQSSYCQRQMYLQFITVCKIFKTGYLINTQGDNLKIGHFFNEPEIFKFVSPKVQILDIMKAIRFGFREDQIHRKRLPYTFDVHSNLFKNNQINSKQIISLYPTTFIKCQKTTNKDIIFLGITSRVGVIREFVLGIWVILLSYVG